MTAGTSAGSAGATITIVRKNFTGFTYDSTRTGTANSITIGGTASGNVIRLYFKRNVNTVNVSYSGDVPTGVVYTPASQDVKYGCHRQPDRSRCRDRLHLHRLECRHRRRHHQLQRLHHAGQRRHHRGRVGQEQVQPSPSGTPTTTRAPWAPRRASSLTTASSCPPCRRPPPGRVTTSSAGRLRERLHER